MTQPLHHSYPPRKSSIRWMIIALIFFGTTINYVDRLVLSILAPDLQAKFSISDAQYGIIGSAFAISYACGQVGAGRLLDRIGVRLGYGLSLLAWSICAMLTSLGAGGFSFAICRAALGVAESPSFPGAAKVCAEWFPRRERAFAFGFVNAGANMAAITTPLVVPRLTIRFGWQAAFLYTGALGVLLAAAWFPLYRRPENHRWVSAHELALIKSDPPEPATTLQWTQIIQYRQAWVFVAGKFLSDGIWWFFMTWIPKFFRADPYDLQLTDIGWPLVTIYVMADLGSLGGGAFSSALLKRGYSVNAARKSAMLLFGTLALPIMFAPALHNLWLVVMVVGLATAGHQGFSSNIYTLCSDLFPQSAVASVAGFGGFFGYVGASLFQLFTGCWVQYTHNYCAPFCCAGIAYILSVGLIHLLSPRLVPAEIKGDSRIDPAPAHAGETVS